MKKILIYSIVFLFLFSVYKDLHVGSLENNTHPGKEDDTITNYNAVYIKVQHGDTILSIMENINETEMTVLDMDRIIEDFKLMNPNADPYQLKTGHFYYFPLY
ncbi:hypothetical protein [Virgibacillus kimchii]